MALILTADFSRCSLLLLASAACLADAAPGAALPTRRAQAKEASEARASEVPAVSAASTAAEACFLVLPQALGSAEVQRLNALGLQELLLGCKGRAEAYFRRALALDADAMTALAGLLSTQRLSPAEASEQADRLQALMQAGVMTTPPEEHMLGLLLALAQGDAPQALELHAPYAARYRRDAAAWCWYQILLADERPGQQDREAAAARLEEARRLFPQHPLALFCALQLAGDHAGEICRAEDAELLAASFPSHPLVQLMAAHLLQSLGRGREALRLLQDAVEHLYPNMPEREQETEFELCLMMQLSLAAELSAAGRDREALALRRRLNALPLPAAGGRTADLLLRWEAHFLPLRVLFRPGARLNLSLIRAAREAAAPATAADNAESRFLVQAANCLEKALRIRLDVRHKSVTSTAESLRELETMTNQLSLDELRQRGPAAALPLAERLLNTCQAARYAALMAVYPDQADGWRPELRRLLRTGRYQLPLLLPGLNEHRAQATKSASSAH